MTYVESLDSATETVGETVERDIRFAGALFFVLAAQFMVVIMLGAAMVPGYDFGAAAISDLGTFPETALLFNVALVVVGVLNLVGGYLFYRTHGRRWLLGLFAVAGVGAIGAGLFPLGTSDLHGIFALVAFLFFNAQAIASATRLVGPMRVVSVLAGLAGLAFVVVMAIGDGGNPAVFGPIGHGGTERMIVYPPMLWLLAFGGYLMAGGADGETPAEGGAPEVAD